MTQMTTIKNNQTKKKKNHKKDGEQTSSIPLAAQLESPEHT